mmetsp:Transcript_140055/g.390373  ORF Transcript_140055/g.390373 Transcript_140055/m.390373 type:complete len:217 (-) Transcript_140055:2381-3031(-)
MQPPTLVTVLPSLPSNFCRSVHLVSPGRLLFKRNCNDLMCSSCEAVKQTLAVLSSNSPVCTSTGSARERDVQEEPSWVASFVGPASPAWVLQKLEGAGCSSAVVYSHMGPALVEPSEKMASTLQWAFRLVARSSAGGCQMLAGAARHALRCSFVGSGVSRPARSRDTKMTCATAPRAWLKATDMLGFAAAAPLGGTGIVGTRSWWPGIQYSSPSTG